MANKAKINSPMSDVQKRGGEAPGFHDHLVIPGGPESLHQPMTPSITGIKFRTGEYSPKSPGGSSRINSPMQKQGINVFKKVK